jgi:hypothetical protein
MVEVGTQTDSTAKLSPKDFPEKSLGRVFPDFNDFRKELRTRLGSVIINIIKFKEENDKGVKETDWTETRAQGLISGHGILWEFVGKNFYFKFRGREYVGEQRDFTDEFVSELAFVIAEIRRKEHI